MKSLPAFLAAKLLFLSGVFAQAADRVEELPGAQAVIYRQIGEAILRLHVFLPPDHRASDRRPAMLIFFGGSWERGDPTQFARHATYFASRGMAVILPDYRTRQYHGQSPLDCVADAKAAMRWTRGHAAGWGIDPTRIAAAGGSAGGYLAAATVIDALEEPGVDTSVSCRPDALVLFNPVLDTTPTGFQTEKFGERALAASPVHNVRPGMPPTIVFHGKADALVPCEQAERYAAAMEAAGNTCRLLTYEKQGHGFYIRKPRYYTQVIQEADRFLVSLGWLQGEPATPPPFQHKIPAAPTL
ncbi:prolyl oligopeptidase family protein [Opitutaceae bacterium TAV1]|nr:prolyl oligopeptidase family protein [Opitutaceae bacterium TAV1]